MLEQSYRRPDPSLLPIPRPGCPKCECRMMLLGIVIGAEGSEVCSFKCRSCGHGIHECGRPGSDGWIAGELKPQT